MILASAELTLLWIVWAKQVWAQESWDCFR